MTKPAQNAPARARRILLVDDDADFVGLFKEFLLGHRAGAWIVHTADNYAPALACLKEHEVDLVVLDLKMPIMDGQQLLSLLRRTHPELQVVILTSSAEPERRAWCLQNGATLFFDKTEIAGGFEKLYAALETLAGITTAPAGTEGFRGMLPQVGLPEVMQLECLSRKSSVLEIKSQRESGRVYIQDGSIVHAELGGIQGEAALFRLLGLKGGEFALKPFSKPGRRTIDGAWESLLMEAARLRDEASAQTTITRKLAEAAAAASSPPGPATPLRPSRIHEVVLCSNVGELLYQWQSAAVDARLQLLSEIVRLSAALAGALSLTRPDRLDVKTLDGRIVLLLQADRRLFIRSGPAPHQASS